MAELAGFFLIFDSNLNALDGGNTDLTPLTSSVLAEVEDQGYSRVSVINPRAESVTVNIDLVAANPANSGTVNRVLQPRAALLADLANDLFPAKSPSAGDYVRVRSNPGVIVSELLGKTGQYLEYLPGQDSGGGGSLLYSPQYAVGDYWRTSISVVNLDTTAGTVAFRLIGQDGHQIGSTRTLPIAANGKVQVSDPGFFGIPGGSPLTQGYVELRTSGVKAVGSVVFSDPARSLLIRRCILSIPLPEHRRFRPRAPGTIAACMHNEGRTGPVIVLDFPGEGAIVSYKQDLEGPII